MKLGKKNLCYSLVLAGIMLLALAGYFAYMLPSLYVAYTKEQNLDSIKEQHKAYVKDGNYDNVQPQNPTACFSVLLPDEGEAIFVTGKFFSVEITAKDEELKRVLEECRALFRYVQSEENTSDYEAAGEAIESHMADWRKIIEKIFTRQDSQQPLTVEVLSVMGMDEQYEESAMVYHIVTEDMLVVEMEVSDSVNAYTNYLAMERTDKGMVFSMLPVMTPDMSHIRPVVLQSMPMLGMGVLLLVLLFSQFYSGGIVAPIERLVSHTQAMRQSEDFSLRPLPEREKLRQDEIGELAKVLDDLYAKVRDNYMELEEKNKKLEEENKRQEIFLRASSHQLKTPISAALLLLDGMISGVGKYENTKEYLPRVKAQLLSMRKMVEDILSLNRADEKFRPTVIHVRELLERLLGPYQVEVSEKHLEISIEGEDRCVNFDEAALIRIIDNLLSNALRYTPEEGFVELRLEEKGISILNHGGHIPKELLPHIFEPFVSGNNGTGAHGLGLYIAAHYAKSAGAVIEIQNVKDGVLSTLLWGEKSILSA